VFALLHNIGGNKNKTGVALQREEVRH
jgi:hypothetical protein